MNGTHYEWSTLCTIYGVAFTYTTHLNSLDHPTISMLNIDRIKVYQAIDLDDRGKYLKPYKSIYNHVLLKLTPCGFVISPYQLRALHRTKALLVST